MSQKTDCLVCFSEVNNDTDNGVMLKCNCCKSVMCESCSKQFLMINVAESQMPQCPVRCREILNTSKLSLELKRLYENAVYKFISHANRKTISKDDMYKELFNKIREQRQTFLQEDMPAALRLTAQIIGQSIIENIEFDNEDINNVDTETSRACTKALCVGFLDSKFTCNICSTEFCAQCEKVRLQEHTCKKEDLESVVYIENMVHCPNPACNLPIERSAGCDHMACATCGTNFNYKTGKFSSIGTAHAPAAQDRRLSTDYDSKDIYSKALIDEIASIENKMLNMPSITLFVKNIQEIRQLEYKKQEEQERQEQEEENNGEEEYYEESETDVLIIHSKSKLCKKVEKYIQDKELFKKGLKLMEKIEQLHAENKLTLRNLRLLTAEQPPKQ